MITLKGSRKAQRRQNQIGAELQLQKIEQHLIGFMHGNESPAQAIKRLVEEVEALRRKERDSQSASAAPVTGTPV